MRAIYVFGFALAASSVTQASLDSDFQICMHSPELNRCMSFAKDCQAGLHRMVNSKERACASRIDALTCARLERLFEVAYKDISRTNNKDIAEISQCLSVSIKTPAGVAVRCADAGDKQSTAYLETFYKAERLCKK